MVVNCNLHEYILDVWTRLINVFDRDHQEGDSIL